MAILEEYIVINEFGKCAKFDESGVFIKWSNEVYRTPYKWAAISIFSTNPGCKIKIVKTNNE